MKRMMTVFDFLIPLFFFTLGMVWFFLGSLQTGSILTFLSIIWLRLCMVSLQVTIDTLKMQKAFYETYGRMLDTLLKFAQSNKKEKKI